MHPSDTHGSKVHNIINNIKERTLACMPSYLLNCAYSTNIFFPQDLMPINIHESIVYINRLLAKFTEGTSGEQLVAMKISMLNRNLSSISGINLTYSSNLEECTSASTLETSRPFKRAIKMHTVRNPLFTR